MNKKDVHTAVESVEFKQRIFSDDLEWPIKFISATGRFFRCLKRWI